MMLRIIRLAMAVKNKVKMLLNLSQEAAGLGLPGLGLRSKLFTAQVGLGLKN